MEYSVYWSGEIVYRNLFLSIIKPNNQGHIREGYIKYLVVNDNNIIMSFACRDYCNPYEEYLKRKNS